MSEKFIDRGYLLDSFKDYNTDIVEKKFDQVNSNLVQLSYDDSNGGKNLLNPSSMTFNSATRKYFNHPPKLEVGKHYRLSAKSSDGTSLNANFIEFNWRDSSGTSVQKSSDAFFNDGFTATSNMVNAPSLSVYSNYIGDIVFQIEEGYKITDYKPYIPSVKMLADENKKQSTEMMDIKMLGWSVPKECPIQNSISGNVFTQKVGRVDLGSLNWTYDSSNGQFYSDVYSTLPSANEWNKNVYSLKYTISRVTQGLTDKSVGIYGGRIYIKDSSYTDASAFKQAMQGQYLYYELATPITRTIDGNEAISQLKNDLGGLSFSVSGTTLSITDGTNTWTLSN